MPPQKDNNIEHIRISNAVSYGFIIMFNSINCDKILFLLSIFALLLMNHGCHCMLQNRCCNKKNRMGTDARK